MYFREDGSLAVDPVTKNPMLGTFTDAEGFQVLEKKPQQQGGSVELQPVLDAIKGLSIQQKAMAADLKAIRSVIDTLA